MKAGYAQTEITPSLDRPIFLAGFGHNRRAESAHDHLYARALAISDGATTLVLCALDLIGFFRSDVSEVTQKVNRPDVQIVIASTHTHHGPDTMGLWGPDDKTRGVDEAWLSAMKEQITATILNALATLQPASVKWASVHVPGLSKNARNPEIVDAELTVFQFTGTDNGSLVTGFNFPCHPEVLWEHNPHITSDYVGCLRDVVEQQTGAPCLFFSGALGGMLTPDVTDHSFAEAEFMGRKLAQAGLAALKTVDAGVVVEPGESQRTIVTGQSSVVHLEKRVIKAKLTNPLYKLAFWRKLMPDIRDRRGMIETEVNLIKIGGLWLATVPGEMLPKLGLALKAQLREAGASVTGIIGLANDELGYILSVEDFKFPWNPFNPGANYEETNSIGKEIGPRVMAALKEML
jgi:hypothetical protein